MKASSGPAPVSIVIPSHNGARYLETCLKSLLRQTRRPEEIVVVDNASTDDSAQVVACLAPRAVLLPLPANAGFAAAANAGMRAARAEWIAVLNNDTEAEDTWIEECLAAADRHPEASFLACRILEFERRSRIYSAGDCFLRSGIGYRRGQERSDQGRYHEEEEVFSACGCAALYRRTVFQACEGFDERFFAYFEDVELGLRLQARGLRGWYVPRAVIYHLGGATSGGEFSPLAVRLRTRNALLLLLKSLPVRILGRCTPMIIMAQMFWLARALSHGRLWSYVRGLAGVLPLMPEMLRARKSMKRADRQAATRLWQAILRSESMAREDVTARDAGASSLFLSWYFKLFSKAP